MGTLIQRQISIASLLSVINTVGFLLFIEWSLQSKFHANSILYSRVALRFIYEGIWKKTWKNTHLDFNHFTLSFSLPSLASTYCFCKLTFHAPYRYLVDFKAGKTGKEDFTAITFTLLMDFYKGSFLGLRLFHHKIANLIFKKSLKISHFQPSLLEGHSPVKYFICGWTN